MCRCHSVCTLVTWLLHYSFLSDSLQGCAHYSAWYKIRIGHCHFLLVNADALVVCLYEFMAQLFDRIMGWQSDKVFRKVGNIVFFGKNATKKCCFIGFCDYLIWSCFWVMCLVMGSENLPLLHFLEWGHLTFNLGYNSTLCAGNGDRKSVV